SLDVQYSVWLDNHTEQEAVRFIAQGVAAGEASVDSEDAEAQQLLSLIKRLAA
ncbi:hypothetical protein H632_c3571p0, partial [Helicosporidium sp. ATCC 50920]